MEFVTAVVDFFLHIDKNLAIIIAQYGTLTYAILFGVIFMETGLVVKVPAFIKTGDKISVDTVTGEYRSRVGN